MFPHIRASFKTNFMDKILRTCTKCKKEKDAFTCFVKDAKSPTGRKTICKYCDQIYRDERNAKKQYDKINYGY
jgi:hypothetical protein